MTDVDYLPHRGDPTFRVHRYELELDYRPAGNALVGRALLTVETACDLTSLQLDLVGLKVDKVSVLGGDPVRWRQAGGRLTVRLPAVVPAGGRLVFDVRYSGKPGPQSGPWGEVGWEELTDGVLVAGEPDGAATWFPCNDLPAHKASFRITVKTDSAYTVLANGVLMQQHVGAGQTTWVYEQAEPMATYLATVQIGRYTAVSRDQRPVPHIVYAPAALADAVVEDTRRQAEMLTLFTELFGPYPFSSYAVVVTDDPLEIPLEAQSLSVFGANHLDGEGRNERLVAHELAHQWFGNSLTVASWKDIWLHEGFACYAEWLWSEGSGTRSAADQAETAWERLATEPQDLVVNDPGPDLMFDDRLYKRGALALHALRTHLGDDRFFELIQAWVSRHRHGSVSSEAFAQIAEEYGGKAATALLHDWVGRVQLPAFTR